MRKEWGGKRWASGGELGRERVDGPTERNGTALEAGPRRPKEEGEGWVGVLKGKGKREGV
jgi:hypothetical protein